MPTHKEHVPNLPLSGTELKALMLRDITRALDGDGLLSGHIAYGRCAYDITVRLHIDNPAFPENVTTARSARPSDQQRAAEPALEAVEPSLPLPGASPDSEVSATVVSRTILSPNAARLEASLPLTVTHKGQDGRIVEEQVTYPADQAARAVDGAPEPIVRDISDETRREFGLPEPGELEAVLDQPPGGDAA